MPCVSSRFFAIAVARFCSSAPSAFASCFSQARTSASSFSKWTVRSSMLAAISPGDLSGENGQRREPLFLPGQGGEFFLLTGSLLSRPFADRVACDRLNPPNAGCNCTLAQDAKRADVARRADMRTAAEFHRVAVQFVGRAADLHHAHKIAVFVAEELHDVGPSLRFG